MKGDRFVTQCQHYNIAQLNKPLLQKNMEIFKPFLMASVKRSAGEWYEIWFFQDCKFSLIKISLLTGGVCIQKKYDWLWEMVYDRENISRTDIGIKNSQIASWQELGNNLDIGNMHRQPSDIKNVPKQTLRAVVWQRLPKETGSWCQLKL